MAYGRFPVPQDIMSDEDKWLRFFNKRQLLWAAIAVVLSFVILRFFYMHGLIPIGIVLATVILLVVGAAIFFKVPSQYYLYGSGLYLETILIRIIYRKLNRVVYVKNYERENEQYLRNRHKKRFALPKLKIRLRIAY